MTKRRSRGDYNWYGDRSQSVFYFVPQSSRLDNWYEVPGLVMTCFSGASTVQTKQGVIEITQSQVHCAAPLYSFAKKTLIRGKEVATITNPFLFFFSSSQRFFELRAIGSSTLRAAKTLVCVKIDILKYYQCLATNA